MGNIVKGWEMEVVERRVEGPHGNMSRGRKNRGGIIPTGRECAGGKENGSERRVGEVEDSWNEEEDWGGRSIQVTKPEYQKVPNCMVRGQVAGGGLE